ncbi:MAG TPA: gluconate 2-dehydrogenase subunit 3 family protein, partial [Rhizomicrobium sp.]|nr:gluconate 2-dehydrogenase subunit 3 family protein [Rhizomicrobium sp.]
AWFAVASSGALALEGCASAEKPMPVPVPAAPTDLWKELSLTPIQAPGYSHDPNLNKPVIPWPLTLEAQQLGSLRIAADLMLPADSHSPSGAALHLDAFIDEWVSAPYPQQQADRRLILSGLAWLDAESLHRFNGTFAQATDAQRRAIFDLVAFRKTVQPGYQRPALFFARLRGLMLAGFYSLPEGIADIGYMGNNPTMGPYPGPTDEAMAHLNASLVKLGLKPVSRG